MDVSNKKSPDNPEQCKGPRVDCATPAPTPMSGTLSGDVGNWAFRNKAFFQSEPGNLGFRNFARSLFAIVPYVFASVGVQHFFQRTVNNGKNTFGRFTGLLKPAIIQNTVGIALSFTTFRTTVKVWSANYDRIFGAKSKEDAAKAVHDLPSNIVKDTVAILPSELAATGISAITLGAIRTGLKTPEPPGSQKNNWSQFKGNFTNDWLANALGYTAFFEASDRLYSVFSKQHKNGVYENGTLPKKENEPEQYSAFTRDGPARLVFRHGASVFLAALPFIATQRYANYKTGNYQPAKHTYMKDVAVGLASWEPSFAIFTSGMELYQRKYDALLKKLQEKYQAPSSSPTI